MYCPWKSWQWIEDERLLCHPVKHETECHKATCHQAAERSSGLTKDWPRASVLLFVSNTLTRPVKLSNSLRLPSSVNNGTLHLAVLSDINKHGHKGIPDTCEGCQAPTCSQTKRGNKQTTEKKEVWESWHTQTRGVNTQRRRGGVRSVRDRYFYRSASLCCFFFNAYWGNCWEWCFERRKHTHRHSLTCTHTGLT